MSEQDQVIQNGVEEVKADLNMAGPAVDRK